MKKTALNRRDEIAKSLMQDGQISTQALAREYGVSVETIRKDLLYLQKSGIAKKGYGGAVVCTEWNEQSFGQKSIEHQAEKARIAGRALDFVCDGDIVILDSGSTVAALARLLLNKKRLTVFTNSLYAAQTLSPADSRVYPVSYTHLDVYKRQAYPSARALPPARCGRWQGPPSAAGI